MIGWWGLLSKVHASWAGSEQGDEKGEEDEEEEEEEEEEEVVVVTTRLRIGSS
jgi:hypothetical protein